MNQNDNEMTPIGKALLVIGGVFLAGTIISALSEDGSKEATAESLPFVKSRPSNTTKRKSKKIFKVVVDEKPKTRKNTVVSKPTSASTNGERKYPDYYYSMSKGQQYNYRLKNRVTSDTN